MDNVRLTPTRSAIKLEPDKGVTSIVVDSCLIGKIILHWPLDKRDVKCIASGQWKCKKDFTVSYIDRNMFMFSFQDKEDWSKVLINTPWNIKGGLLILSPWTSGKIPEELQFSFSPFWVQVHGLPLNYITKENGLKIGQVLGKFLHVDGNVFDGKVFCRKFLRIRVVLDVTKPLLCGFWVRRAELSDIWIEFKYEKLGIFCYKCGRIGNHYKSCKFPAVKAKFGPWLYAEPLNDGWSIGGIASSSSSPSPFGGGGRATVVERETHTCTSLILVPQPKEAALNQSSISEPEGCSFQICERMESSQIYQGSDEFEDISKRNLWHRLIVNSIDSLAMTMNCTLISCRVARPNPYEGNWRLLMVMVAYFSYLVLKLIRVAQRSWLLGAFNCQAPTQELSLMALMELFIVVVFWVMLKSL